MRLDLRRLVFRQAAFGPGGEELSVHVDVALHDAPLRRTFLAGILARPWKNLGQIQRTGVRADRGEALGDLGFTDSRLLQLLLDVFANDTAGSCKMTRRGRLMLAKRAPDLGEREVLGIVAGESEPIAWFESCHRRRECSLYQLKEPSTFERHGGLRRRKRRGVIIRR